MALGRMGESGQKRMVVKAEPAQHHVRCRELDELRRGQPGKDLRDFLADAEPEHGFHLVFAHESLRQEEIGEINLPDLLENFTTFQFFPATKILPGACPVLTDSPRAAGDQIVDMRFRRALRTTMKTSAWPHLRIRYKCYRV